MKAPSWVLVAVVVTIFLSSIGFFAVGTTLFVSSQDEALFGDGDIAVIKVEGEILSSDKIVRQINKVAKDDNIKAVVVRINSPGGTIGGSQEIFREVKKMAEKKPVVASMGTVAASGGYYIACGAEKILANPGTITGSIGVRFEHVNAEGLITWLGLKPKTFKSGQLKDLGSPYRQMTAQESGFLQSTLDSLHEQFKTHVSEERKIDMTELNKIADGRVITGEQALQYKLVDQLGTLQDAIDLSAKMAGLEENPDVVYPKKEKYRIIDMLLEAAVDKLIVTVKTHLSMPAYTM
jgi:protease IV